MSYLQNREEKNRKYIDEQIYMKNSSNPYHNSQHIYNIRNEYDSFPYPNWFKGIPESENPIISEREAGWIPKSKKYENKKYQVDKPTTCFQSACSIIYPCYMQDNSYILLNKACIPENK
jgi:hypothetical protein